jgi:heme/copper-type cytochrome/quinol oxidase subunit 2
VGHYQINCAQLCGNSHANMSRGMLIVESQKDFDDWLAKKPTAGAGSVGFE